MKKSWIPLAALIITTVISCKKNNTDTPLPLPPADVDDARTVLLKDVVEVRLPSPYFHFTYDDHRYVKQINFASGFNIYDVAYENKRVKKMTNINNNNFLLYSYSNNQVSEINEFSGRTGEKIFSYRLTYKNSNQLTQVLWFEFSTGNNGILYKKSVLKYQGDGNLASIDHFSTSPGQLTLVKRDEFSNYDDKINVDDFYLLKDFFDSLLFLPQVKLQKNNPQKQIITGFQNDYNISFTYQYQNSLPVKRSGIVVQTKGNGNQPPIEITNLYDYY